ncbi:MAG TPA: FtsX-like permease family protein, partial [Acidimicrobiales bacterium]|nr:FtsX-like permease family protein [Acidimicrobiales bacterium]
IWGPQPSQEIWLQPAPGISPDAIAAEVAAAHLAGDIRAYTPTAFVNEFASDVDQMVQPFWVLQRGMMGLALLASLSTLLLIGVQRRREMGLLSALGLSRGGLVRLTVTEAAGVGAVAALLGAVTGAVIVVAFKEVSGFLFGLQPRLDWSGMPLPMLIYSLLAVVAVLVGGGLPAWRASRLQPAVALRYE